jgi:hypothetical protein
VHAAASGADVRTEAEQALLVHIPLSDDKFGTPGELAQLQALELELGDLIDDAGVGELDGNEIGGGEYMLFFYGPNADVLLQTVEARLRASPLLANAWAIKRYGPATATDASKVRVELKAE